MGNEISTHWEIIDRGMKYSPHLYFTQKDLLTGPHTASRYYVDVTLFLWYGNKKSKNTEEDSN